MGNEIFRTLDTYPETDNSKLLLTKKTARKKLEISKPAY